MQEMSFAVTVTSVEGRWVVRPFSADFDSASHARKAAGEVRNLRSEGAAFAMLCVEDEYFVIVRPAPGRNLVLISDITMAVDDEFAAAFAEDARHEIPDIDPDELDDVDGWPEGDFEILADMGLSEEVLGVIADDQEAYPHEALMRIADELGFADELADAANY